ncbi:MAG: hypothetical protein DKT66_10160 [Candidatus Melainabacteria bacterium]|nr:MAG: hypothetical protein DKT66_10160 [Candidatus Melainabacteria bacterium]
MARNSLLQFPPLPIIDSRRLKDVGETRHEQRAQLVLVMRRSGQFSSYLLSFAGWSLVLVAKNFQQMRFRTIADRIIQL